MPEARAISKANAVTLLCDPGQMVNMCVLPPLFLERHKLIIPNYFSGLFEANWRD